MKSQNTQISIEDSILNLEKNLIDSKINAKIKDNSFAIALSGETLNPKISIDLKDLIKEKIIKQLEKKEKEKKKKKIK